MAEQQRAREMGAGQALSGLSGMYGNLGQQALGQAYRELGYLSGVGEAQRGMGQQRADIAYQDFMAQRDFPDTQLQKYSSLIQGFPYQISMPGMQPSQFQQTVGAATALGGLGRGLGFFTQGGQVEAGGKKYPNTGLAALAQERPDVVKKMGYKDGGTVYRQEAGQIGRPNISGLSAFFAPFAGPRTNPFKDMSDDEVAQIARFGDNPMKQEAAERELAERMSKVPTGKSPLKQQTSQTPDSSLFDTADAMEMLARSGNTGVLNTKVEDLDKELKRQGVSPEALLQNENAAADAEKILADKKSKDNKADKPTESVEDLEKVLEEAYKFDREAKEKAIKSQQGFDVAALGLQLMSTPLSKIDPRMISQLGVSQKELAGLSEEEAKEKLQKALTRIAIKKSKADIARTEAETQKDLAEAGYYSGLGGLKEQVSPFDIGDIEKLQTSTELSNSTRQKEGLELANTLTEYYNGPSGIGLSKEQKDAAIKKSVAKFLSTGINPLSTTSDTVSVQTPRGTADRLLR